MNQYQAVCLDLDGTVYKGMKPIESSVRFIHHLQQRGIEPYFVTNNSSMTPMQVKEKLGRMGVCTSPDHIVTSAVATANYCAKHYQGATVYMIGEEGLASALKDQGMAFDEQQPDLVVIGIDRNIHYKKLAQATRFVRAGARLLATNMDIQIPSSEGIVPGNGAFVKLLELTSDQQAKHFGKPEPYLLEMIQQKGAYQKEDMILIGDNYETDILAGLRFGIDTAYVQGGVTPIEVIQQATLQPTYICQSLMELIR